MESITPFVNVSRALPKGSARDPRGRRVPGIRIDLLLANRKQAALDAGNTCRQSRACLDI